MWQTVGFWMVYMFIRLRALIYWISMVALIAILAYVSMQKEFANDLWVCLVILSGSMTVLALTTLK